MGIKIPKIGWKRKPVTGDPIIREKGPAPVTTDLVSTASNVKESFPIDEQLIIDKFLDDLDQYESDLDYIDQKLDEKLADMVLSYDPKEQVMLAKAHKCKYCGNPNAGNFITSSDIKRNDSNLQKLSGSFSSSIVPHGFESMNANEISAQQQKGVETMIAEMLASTAKEILIIVLEFIYNIFKPLSNIPIANSIPDSIKATIRALRGDQSKEEFDKNIEAITAKSWNQSLDDSLKRYPNEATVRPNKNSLSGLMTICVQHTSDFKKYSEELMIKDKKFPYYALKRENQRQRETLEDAKVLASSVIPDQYEKSDGSKYANTASADHLKAIPNGRGISPILLRDASGELVVLKKWTTNAKRILEQWFGSQETLCCLLVNLLKITGVSTIVGYKFELSPDMNKAKSALNEAKRMLYTIRATIMAYRGFLTLDLKNKLIDSGNMILKLIETVLVKMINAYGLMLRSQLVSKTGSLSSFAKSVEGTGVPCVPWTQLIHIFGDSINILTEELNRLLRGLFNKWQMSGVNGQNTISNSEKILKIDYYIGVIDAVISFLDTYITCIANEQDITKLSISPSAGAVSSGIYSNGIQKTKKSATIYSDGGVSGLKPKAKTPIPEKDVQSKESISSAWKVSEPGLRILLTNFIGLSEKDADAALNTKGDCSCDDGLTDEELAIIQKALSK